MRFFEFKLPAPGTDLAAKIETEIDSLINVAEENPELQQKVAQDLRALIAMVKKAKPPVQQQPAQAQQPAEQFTENQSTILINLKATLMAEFEGILDAAKKEIVSKKIEALLKATAAQAEQAGADKFKKSAEATHDDFKSIGDLLAKKLKQPSGWAKTLINNLRNTGLDDELLYVFLEQCLPESTTPAMSWPFKQGVQDIDFRTLLSAEAKEVVANQEAVSVLIKTLWQGGSGKAGGEGEVFVGLMTPGGTMPAKGDVIVDNRLYEVKATYWSIKDKNKLDSTEAWLDSGPFAENVQGVKNEFKRLADQHGATYDEADMKYATFRLNGLPELNKILSTVSDAKQLMVELHRVIFPNVDDADIVSGVEKMMTTGIIDNHLTAAKEQGVMAMKEYAAGQESFGFVLIDKTTLKGTVMVDAFDAAAGFRFTSPVNMSKFNKKTGKMTSARKAVPGIMVGSREEAASLLGWQTKRGTSTKTTTPKTVVMASDPKAGFWVVYGSEAGKMLKNLQLKHGAEKVKNDFQTMTLPEFEKAYNVGQQSLI